MTAAVKPFSRADVSPLARWWWTVDRGVLAVAAALIGAGVVLAFAASPAVAERLRLADPFHFADRQAIFAGPAFVLLLAVSFLAPRHAMRLGVLTFAGAFVACLFAILFGPEINGAHRWIPVGPVSLQPSEFLKPGFVLFAAWIYARGLAEPRLPAAPIVAGAFALCALILAVQPDYGQAALLGAIWAAMFFIVGMSWRWMLGLAGAGAAGLAGAYLFAPHVASRIDRFLKPQTGDTYQVDAARDAVASGGILGRGPGEGVVKWRVPDAHTDFVFAVGAEEYGAVAALLLLAGVAYAVMRGLRAAAMCEEAMHRYAASGLFLAFGAQALVNVGVTLQLLPAKGMTFPFVSYGGSSLMASALGLGLALALIRAPKRRSAL